MTATKKPTKKAQELAKVARARVRQYNKEFIESKAPDMLAGIEECSAKGKRVYRKMFSYGSGENRDRVHVALLALVKYFEKQGFSAGFIDPDNNGSNQFPNYTTRVQFYVKW